MRRKWQGRQAGVRRLLVGMAIGLLVGFGPASSAPAASPSGTATTSAVAPPPAVLSGIAANERAFLKAVLAQDVAALNVLLADDFACVHENGWISTRAQFLTDFVAKGCVAAELKQKEPARQHGGTVFTVSTGHLQWKGESPHPPTTVTHIWVEQGGRWVLAHRHESHKGEPVGKQLSQRGGPNRTGDLGSKPSPELAKLINEREAAWVYCMLTTDEARMDELVDESPRHVHVTGHTSDKAAFMKELRGGYRETYFLDSTMRQFGGTVLVLHRAQYRHTGGPEQSISMALHAWVKRGGRWVLAGRQSTRFESH